MIFPLLERAMHGGYMKGCAVAILLAFCFSVPTAWAVERCVLVELLTWVECSGCPQAEAALNSLSEEYPDDSLAIIRYHPQPGPSNPFYQQKAFDRALSYYEITGFPTLFFDGGMKIYFAFSESLAYAAYKDSIEIRLAIPSPLSMNLSVTYDTLSYSGQAITQVTAVDSVEADILYLRYALIESGLLHEAETYEEVLRDMYPDDQGVGFILNRGETFRDTTNFTLGPQWLPENCDLVVFVQDDATKEVLQSIQTWIPLPQVPVAVKDVKLTLAGSSLLLTWSPVTQDKYGHPLTVDGYRVYKDTSLSFVPENMTLLDSTLVPSYLDSACSHVGDTQANCSYYVTAVAGGLESSPSRIVGEYDLLVEYLK
jgi:hypothetical protein